MARNKHKKTQTDQPPETGGRSSWSPWALNPIMEELRRDMVDPFHAFWARMPVLWPSAERGRAPRLDIRDHGSAYEIVAELPGVPKENVHVSVSENQIEIRGETSQQREEEAKDYYHREIGHQAFFRSLPLPPDANPNDVDAKMADGCLRIRIKKRESAAVRKRVPVR